MGNITAKIEWIGELDFSKFNIPFYQRPYRWQPSHVETLLNCIKDNMGKGEYRIGSIIIHQKEDTEELDVVDGQQRLTTLSLILLCLDENTSYRLDCDYQHIESKRNIYNNYHYIEKWIECHNINKDKLQEFILKKCSVVIITTEDLSEAFQMFDSQNGRGKELEAYNLLKAYHLRAIDNEVMQITPTSEKKQIDIQWEKSVLMKTDRDEISLLKYIVNELYRMRQWSKQKKGWSFGKSKIKEFKGMQFNNSQSQLPLQNCSLLLYLYYNKTKGAYNKTEGVAVRSQDSDLYPFVSINMDIINGELFFTYIQTYISAYNYLFKTEFNPNHILYKFREDYNNYCLNYKGSHRLGDRYVRELYVALVLALYDRFGEGYVGKYYKTLYNLAYRKRLEHWTIFYSTVAEFPIKYFETIASAIDESGLESLVLAASQDIWCKRLSNKENEIAKYIVCNCSTAIICPIDGCVVGNKKFNNGDKIKKSDFIDGTF